jgi:hypothetical protein
MLGARDAGYREAGILPKPETGFVPPKPETGQAK